MNLLFRKEKSPYVEWQLFVQYMTANPHPCQSLAQSQLPHLRPPPPPNALFPIALFPANKESIYMQTILTCPTLLPLGTLHYTTVYLRIKAQTIYSKMWFVCNLEYTIVSTTRLVNTQHRKTMRVVLLLVIV
jgi:hypothetical protein